MPLVYEAVDRNFVPGLRAPLEAAQIVRIQNVAAWYWSHDQDFWELHRHFPNVAPPWPIAWYEYHMPRVVQTTHGPQRATPLGVGALVQAIEEPADSWDPDHWLLSACKTMLAMTMVERLGDVGAALDAISDILADDARTLAACPAPWRTDMRAALGKLPAYWRQQQVRWVLQLATYIEDPGLRVPLPYYVDFLPVCADGTIPWAPRTDDPTAAPALLRLLICATPTSLDLFHRPAPYFHPVLLANCFAHCKNVTVLDDAPPAKLAKRNAEKGRPPLTWKTLEIDPLVTAIRRGPQGEPGQRATAAMHIVRGHFSTYDEKPLFGKWRGTWFVPSHLRGSLERGLAGKDYSVLAKR
jgi:hypothetical protein